jgi:hypothetical protein
MFTFSIINESLASFDSMIYDLKVLSDMKSIFPKLLKYTIQFNYFCFTHCE